MKTVNMHDAKSSLSRLVREISTGAESEVIIAIDGTPAARLVPLTGAPRRMLGLDYGLVTIAHDFDAPNAEITELFEGR
ncbi:MAG: type II toxin-antitoxin system Phd/YefM family antitoxin [Candidatus Eremiobacteraeota bacterium]|nr:type II toxin-antitoxin system Phd/YefM family antitoxin [Candidatus Eremiobacteraeota bacterium]